MRTPADAPGPDLTDASDHEPRDPELVRALRAATDTLELIARDRTVMAQMTADERQRLLIAAGKVFNPDFAARRRLVKASVRMRKAGRVNRDESLLNQAGIRVLRRQDVFTTPNVWPPEDFAPEDVAVPPGAIESMERQNCYVCKENYRELHHFYDQLCPACGEFNLAKRTELADLSGRVALLTGGRVKIGYQAGLKMLRCGAQLIVTTRFPRDSAARYAAEPDFGEWCHRLEI
ncbi:MAG: putative dehydrogenase, partial [bacterium]